jgi:predicted nucleotidyltransferase
MDGKAIRYALYSTHPLAEKLNNYYHSLIMHMSQKEIIQKLNTFLQKKEEILIAYLFGSYATNTATPLSDIDVALLVTQSRLAYDIYYRLDITADLLSVLHANKVDVVILNKAPPILAHRVMRHGIVVENKDDQARILFEVNTLKKYIDTKRLREIQSMYVRKWLAG